MAFSAFVMIRRPVSNATLSAGCSLPTAWSRRASDTSCENFCPNVVGRTQRRARLTAYECQTRSRGQRRLGDRTSRADADAASPIDLPHDATLRTSAISGQSRRARREGRDKHALVLRGRALARPHEACWSQSGSPVRRALLPRGPGRSSNSLRSSNASAFAQHDGRARRARRGAPRRELLRGDYVR